MLEEILDDIINKVVISCEKKKIQKKKKTKSNANINGSNFENLTNLNLIKIKNTEKFNIVRYNRYELTEISKTHFPKYFKLNKNEMPHGCKNPDEVYLINKSLFIIEKKNQNVGGSTCEKIQTGIFKKLYFENILPTYKIYYIYCLSNWFHHNCKIEIELLKKSKIDIFIADENYKQNIINFMIKNL